MDKPKAPDVPDVDVKKPGVAAAAGVAGAAAVGTAAAAKATRGKKPEAKDEPYGSGSLRLAAGAKAPTGYTIKGNEDSMLYHTPDSPWYMGTIAEVWFRDEETAKKAGFGPWHKGNK